MTSGDAGITLIAMRHLALLALLMPACFTMSGGDDPLPQSSYSCDAVLRCMDLPPAEGNFHKCADSAEEAADLTQDSCEAHAHSISGCSAWVCDVDCSWRGPCLD